MHYLSPEFALAFILFLWVYWFAGLCGGTGLQNRLLLLASYGFYASFDVRFAGLLAGFSVTLLGLARLALRYPRWQKAQLALGVCAAVVNLGLFKYYNFFRETLAEQFELHSLPLLDMALPVGISFYTFSGIAYLVAVVRQQQPPPNFIHGLLYLSFFPTLLAGPICRPQDLLPQIDTPTPRQLTHFSTALVLITCALAKKMWLASWLAQDYVNPVFANPLQYHGLEVLGAACAYAWQLYFDFSGYTDLVTALALLLGFRLPLNFNQPYLAKHLTDFWQRWHISLSLFIRDFIYIPLGGNRKGWLRTQVHLVLAMVVSGLWHGAGATFLLWGLWHGAGYVIQNSWRRLQAPALPAVLGVLLTFSFVTGGWVIFRAEDLQNTQDFFTALGQWQHPISLNLLLLGAALWAFFAFSIKGPARLYQLRNALMQRAPWQQAAFALAALTVIFALSPAGMPGFIYYGF